MIAFSMLLPLAKTGLAAEKITMDFYTIGTRTDLSWSQGIYEASEYIKNKYPEVIVRFGDNIPYAEFPSVLEARAQMGVQIFYTESAWFEAAQKVMPRFPKSWIQLTGLLKEQLDVIESDNVFSYTQTEEQGGYLAGVVAGMVTKTNKIGMIAGADYPDIVRTGVGFIEGAKFVNPKAEFTVMYTGDWVDVQKGYEAAKSMIEAGADIIWHYNDNAGKGIAKAAEDFKGRKVYIVGETRDQIDLAPDRVLTSCRVDHSRLAETILNDFKAGRLKKGDFYFGIEEGWPVIAPVRNAPPEVEAKVNEVREAIKRGEIKVPLRTDPEALTGYRSH
jgi:basic membrane protein A